MPYFTYNDQQLCAEQVPLKDLAAEFGTPCYVYSQQAITDKWLQYANALTASNKPHMLFYAIKANSNLAILNLLAKLGAGFDAVSGGEIARVIAADGDPSKIVFSGVGKSREEISQAIDLGIHSINIESEAELLRIQEIAKQKDTAISIAFRINPNVAANSHPYISTGTKHNKFGIDHTAAVQLYKLAASLSHVTVRGMSCHIGSQITTLEPFLAAIDQLLLIIDELSKHNISIEYLDVGGGLGVRYQDEAPPTVTEYINAVLAKIGDRNLELHFEPGRSVVANAGVILTKVEYLKSTDTNNFVIVDAAMTELIRPALYQSYHDIVPVQLAATTAATATNSTCSVVGPVCESSDFLGMDRTLSVTAGDILAIKDSGAYGFSMSSNYNTRPKCPEILVSGKDAYVISERESIAELFKREKIADVPRFTAK